VAPQQWISLQLRLFVKCQCLVMLQIGHRPGSTEVMIVPWPKCWLVVFCLSSLHGATGKDLGIAGKRHEGCL
jgi:hypothetical protein